MSEISPTFSVNHQILVLKIAFFKISSHAQFSKLRPESLACMFQELFQGP